MKQFLQFDEKFTLKAVFDNLKNYAVVGSLFLIGFATQKADLNAFFNTVWRSQPWLQQATIFIAFGLGCILGLLNLLQSAKLLEKFFMVAKPHVEEQINRPAPRNKLARWFWFYVRFQLVATIAIVLVSSGVALGLMAFAAAQAMAAPFANSIK